MERGPAGNTSLAAAFAIAQEREEDQVLVVQETEYTGAGKHHTAQLSFARERGIEARRGDPREQIPGKNILFPSDPSMIGVRDLDMDNLRRSYLKKLFEAKQSAGFGAPRKGTGFPRGGDQKNRDYVQSALKELESW